MSIIRDLLESAVSNRASDIHLKADSEPFFRVHGALVESGFETISAQNLLRIVDDIVPQHLKDDFRAESEADFSHYEEGVGRFRVNVFYATGTPAVAFRHVKDRIPSLEELNLPAVLYKLCEKMNGIIILSGTTGSGKSTTLAALVEHINQTVRERIITVEDPVEYVFRDKMAVITQREVGLDTESFHAALKRLMRQDPDVIMIGEMRDPVSFSAALIAAETGHLVFTTLHSSTASQAVSRILDLFPAEERDQIRMSLASNLKAIICQRLMPAAATGVVPACEILINTPTVRKLLERNRLDVLAAAVETGVEDGMQTFNQSIYQWIKKGVVTEAEGMRHATNPEALRMNLQGIFLDEAKRILSTT